MLTHTHIRAAAFCVTLVLLIGGSVFAFSEARGATPCGYLIDNVGGRPDVPIEDCDRPFGVQHTMPGLAVHYGGARLAAGASYAFLDATSTTFTISGTDDPDIFALLYAHDGTDRILKKRILGDTTYVFDRPGTYSFVIMRRTDNPVPVYRDSRGETLFDMLKDIVVPPAYAAHGIIDVITFTVEPVPPEPSGVSNVLFLPGIQASRLYSGENGEEERRWEPGGNDDVAALAMTPEGESERDIYSRDVIREIGGFALGGNIYKTFLQSLRDIGGPFGGPVIETFPYDWRRSVSDIVEEGTPTENGVLERPTTMIALLAETSATDKVTLIAHSNGGLLAKAIMRELEAERKTDLVDRVILIAAPQTGTPKGLAALLHGYDQEQLGGLLVDDEVVRGVMRNMPGAYGLLPSASYVSAASTPLISFDDSAVAAPYRDVYGATITNTAEYTQFLTGSEGREDPGDDVRRPIRANETLLTEALATHEDAFDQWRAPDGVEVYEIIGTGLPTLSALRYRSFTDATCSRIRCTTHETLKPYAQFTRYGDETVVSASASQGIEKELFINLDAHNQESSIFNDFVHANITEAAPVQTLITRILHGSSTSAVEAFSENEPTFEESFDVHSIHSPARIYITDVEGNVSGRTKEGGAWKKEVPRSDYFEFGESKYLVVPSDLEYDVTVEGEGRGVYTLKIDELKNKQSPVYETSGGVREGTVLTYSKKNDEFSLLKAENSGSSGGTSTRRLECAPGSQE